MFMQDLAFRVIYHFKQYLKGKLVSVTFPVQSLASEESSRARKKWVGVALETNRRQKRNS